MIFVTGATGLIGSFLLRELQARGLKVRALHRGLAPTESLPEIDWVQGDILDATLLTSAISPEVTHVFHCAGLVSYAPQDEDALLQTNVEGTAAVVDACLARPGIRLGYVSSVAALGAPAEPTGEQLTVPRQIVTEKATWDLGASHPAYATSKYLGELEVWRGAAEGLAAVIVNPSVVLGPGDWERSSTRLLRYAYDEHRFYTKGLLNFVDVRDVVAHLVRLVLDLPPTPITERYILNGGAYPLGDFLRDVAVAFSRRPPTVAVPDWAAEIIWRLEHGRAVLTGARPLITRDTARAGRQHIYYDASKVQLATGLGFRSLGETIAWATQGLKTNRTPPQTVVS
jgi:dihydroflavonol-4-reductase